MKTVVVFANVLFEEFGNQSVRNFVEGILTDRQVLFITVAAPSEFMRPYEAAHPRLRVVYVGQHARPAEETSRSPRRLRRRVKQLFRYKRYAANSEVWQWLSIKNTLQTLRLVHRSITEMRSTLDACEQWVFVDVFGGMLLQYLRWADPELWRKIAARSVGYYLGTVLSQFRDNTAHAIAVMPLSFVGSYRVPHRRLIITNDGTDGERVFRDWLKFRGDILFIRNGSDTRLREFKAPVKKRDEGVVRFVTCSRLSGWKRVDRAIRFVALVSDLISENVHLTIIGEGEERARLEALVQRVAIADRVTFAGGLQYEQALALVSEHDYAIIFNDLSNLGNQVNEAIVLGVVPVTIDDGSTDALLTHDVNALKIPMSARFEEEAAREFARHHNAGERSRLLEGLIKSRDHVFSWGERNRREREFMLDSHD